MISLCSTIISIILIFIYAKNNGVLKLIRGSLIVGVNILIIAFSIQILFFDNSNINDFKVILIGFILLIIYNLFIYYILQKFKNNTRKDLLISTLFSAIPYLFLMYEIFH